MNDLSVASIEPGVFFLAALVVCLVLEAAGAPIGTRKRGPRMHLALVLLVAAACAVAHARVLWGDLRLPVVLASGGLALDRLSLVGTALAGILVACSVVAGASTLCMLDAERGETWGLLALLGLGLTALVSAADLVFLSVALTLWHIAILYMVAIDRDSPQGIEAGAKTLAAGAVTTSAALFAAALAYGSSGDVSFAALGTQAAGGDPLALTALALTGILTASLLGIVPLHSPSVDVAQGAPPFASALISAGGVVAGTVIALRIAVPVCEAAASPTRPALLQVVVLAAFVTLVAAPLAAVDQSRVARMVAYLIALQGGFVLTGIAAAVAGSPAGLEAALVTTVTSALAIAAAWCGTALLPRTGSTWEDWSGLGRRHPALATAFLIALASLAGLPGTAGFIARSLSVRAAFDAGANALAVGSAIAPALAMASTLRLGIFLFAKLPKRGLVSPATPSQRAALLVLTAVLAIIGFWPRPLVLLLGDAVRDGGAVVAPVQSSDSDWLRR